MPVAFKDYYDTLEVPRAATDAEIRKAFRKLARKHHPDVNPGDKSAEEKFKEINEAYQVLSDSEKRKRYDQLGPDWNSTPPPGPQPGAGGSNGSFRGFGDGFGEQGSSGFSDFFEGLFGRRGASARPRRGVSIEAELTLTLEEVHRGGTRTISLQTSEPCPECGGSGKKDGKTCPKCHGAGEVRGTRSLDVTIPAGVRNGAIIRLAGQGEAEMNGTPAGDLLLHVRIAPHRLFRMVGEDDLELELPVAPWEAALGAKVLVPTLDAPVEMTIGAGTQSGQVLRLRGQGLTKRGAGRGDQLVRLKIVIPPKMTSKEKALFAKLAAESHFDARELMGLSR